MTLHPDDRRFFQKLTLWGVAGILAVLSTFELVHQQAERRITDERRRVTDENMKAGREQRDRMEAMLRALMDRR